MNTFKVYVIDYNDSVMKFICSDYDIIFYEKIDRSWVYPKSSEEISDEIDFLNEERMKIEERIIDVKWNEDGGAEMDGVIDLSPMGCRTGFYFTIFGDRDEAYVAEHLLNVLKKVK